MPKRNKESRMYNIWSMMKQRCTNPTAANYCNYGGRGITFCDRWASYAGFLEDMGYPPSDKHTLDRIDNNGNYTKENCQWSTMTAQNNNKRNCVYVTAFGKTMSVQMWTREIGTTRDIIMHRINVMKMSPEDALTIPRMSHVKKPVLKIRNGEVVARYESLADAGRAEGVDKRVMWNALKGKSKSAMGYQWRYEE